MKELKIHKFQAEHIEDTLRIVANIIGSRTKETCTDRNIMKAIEYIKNVLNETIDKPPILIPSSFGMKTIEAGGDIKVVVPKK